MNKDLVQKKNDYLLELALEEQLDHDEDMQKYSEEVVEPHEFSPEHEAKMRELFKKAEKVERNAGRKRTRIQVAAGIAMVLCCSTLMVTQVDAFRVPVYNFFTEVKEKATRFGVEEEGKTSISSKFKPYMPSYIANGFNISDIKEKEGLFYIVYQKSDSDERYIFRYYGNVNDVVIDTEDAIVEEIEIQDSLAYLVKEDDKIRILLTKDGSQYYLSGTISQDEAIKIMESINFE